MALNPELNVVNLDIKNFINRNYGDSVKFCIPSDQKQPTFIFDSQL